MFGGRLLGSAVFQNRGGSEMVCWTRTYMSPSEKEIGCRSGAHKGDGGMGVSRVRRSGTGHASTRRRRISRRRRGFSRGTRGFLAREIAGGRRAPVGSSGEPVGREGTRCGRQHR